MKKRIFPIFLALAFLLTALAGCSKDTSDSKNTPNATDKGGSTPAITDKVDPTDSGGANPGGDDVNPGGDDVNPSGGDVNPGGGENTPADSDVYYIGDNGSVYLYAWLPEGLLDDIYPESQDGGCMAGAEYYDPSTEAALMFYAIIASGDFLQSAVDEAKADYDGAYSSDADLLFSYLRDNYMVAELGSDFPGDVDDGNVTLNGRDWRYCEAYAEVEGEGGVDLMLLFWMEGNDMALVMVSGIVEDPNSFDDVTDTLAAIVLSLQLNV